MLWYFFARLGRFCSFFFCLIAPINVYHFIMKQLLNYEWLPCGVRLRIAPTLGFVTGDLYHPASSIYNIICDCVNFTLIHINYGNRLVSAASDPTSDRRSYPFHYIEGQVSLSLYFLSWINETILSNNYFIYNKKRGGTQKT